MLVEVGVPGQPNIYRTDWQKWFQESIHFAIGSMIFNGTSRLLLRFLQVFEGWFRHFSYPCGGAKELDIFIREYVPGWVGHSNVLRDKILYCTPKIHNTKSSSSSIKKEHDHDEAICSDNNAHILILILMLTLELMLPAQQPPPPPQLPKSQPQLFIQCILLATWNISRPLWPGKCSFETIFVGMLWPKILSHPSEWTVATTMQNSCNRRRLDSW